MTANKYPEAQKMILYVKRAPFSEEEKARLGELLTSNGMTDETTEAVHQALLALPKEAFKDDWQRAKFMMDFGNVLKQWQMTLGSKKFRHTR